MFVANAYQGSSLSNQWSYVWDDPASFSPPQLMSFDSSMSTEAEGDESAALTVAPLLVPLPQQQQQQQQQQRQLQQQFQKRGRSLSQRGPRAFLQNLRERSRSRSRSRNRARSLSQSRQASVRSNSSTGADEEDAVSLCSSKSSLKSVGRNWNRNRRGRSSSRSRDSSASSERSSSRSRGRSMSLLGSLPLPGGKFKTVSFAPSETYVWHEPLFKGEEAERMMSILWYDDEFLKNQKDMTLFHATKVAKTRNNPDDARYADDVISCGHVFKLVYKACSRVRMETSINVLGSDDGALLETYYQVAGCDGRRGREVGLERFLHRIIAKDTRDRRLQLLQVVRNHNEIVPKLATDKSYDLQLEKLRRDCQHLSRASRLFARNIAVAQTKAPSRGRGRS